ncbi:hypothetical protein LTR95_002429 [Oleoguttula sp. CCFEE 5521]
MPPSCPSKPAAQAAQENRYHIPPPSTRSQRYHWWIIDHGQHSSGRLTTSLRFDVEGPGCVQLAILRATVCQGQERTSSCGDREEDAIAAAAWLVGSDDQEPYPGYAMLIAVDDNVVLKAE